LEAKILPKVVNLEEKVEGMQTKMEKLEERATQREVRLGQVEGELAEKIELFKKTEEELNNDDVDAYGEGFQDAITQFSAFIMRWIFLLLMSPNVLLVGNCA